MGFKSWLEKELFRDSVKIVSLQVAGLKTCDALRIYNFIAQIYPTFKLAITGSSFGLRQYINISHMVINVLNPNDL